ncbi:hypothetical protein [Actinomycetospora aeridis]|uniref:Polyketide cyclase/dehydrase/lipid transport protein n=1 Tax=Actinomycetospora aeridis TaxID=3129231 RepID=A0ABU8N8C7_9PSEU
MTGDSMLTTCARCSASGRTTDRFCRGCGLRRSELSAAVEEAFAPAATAPSTGRHHAVTAVDAADDPDTVALRVPPPRVATPPSAVPTMPPPRPSSPPPRPTLHASPPPPPRPAAKQPPLTAWHGGTVGLAALLTVLLVVEAVIAMGGALGGDADGAGFVVLVLPRLALAAGGAGVLAALAQQRASALAGSVTLAVVVLAMELGTAVDAPGAFAATVAIALASVVLGAPAALLRPVPGRIATTLAVWVAVGAVVAAFAGFAYGSIAGQVSASYAGGGVLFLLVAGVAVACAAGLRAGRVPAAWALAGSWVLTLVAVSVADLDGLGLSSVVVLHLAAAIVALAARPVAASLGPGALATWDRARVTVDRVPRPWVLGGGLVLAVATGLLLAVSGTSASGYSGGNSSTGVTVMIVIVGLLALAATATPTLPWFWRVAVGLGGLLALGIAWSGSSGSGTGSSLTWILVLPLALIGGAVWGALVNHRHGATSSRPGWVGAGSAPPPYPLSFLIPPTAGARSRLALHADVALPPEAVLDAVRRVTAVRGNWFVVFDDTVEIEGEQPGVVALHVGGHCHFRARVESRGGRTVLRVGGMDRYLQSRSWYGFIPVGPAHVQGFWMYKLFLQTVAAELARLDPRARLSIAGPSQAAVA